MELPEIRERLNHLDTNKLIDVVKNYRQYGYNDDIRNYALKLLEEQGITKNDLFLTGNLENKTYNFANDLFSSFRANSKIAFVFYSLAIIIKLITPPLHISSNFVNTIIIIVFILSVVVYFIYLFKSFLNQNEFYKLAGDEFGSEGALMYLVLGMPLYLVMYFVFQNQMKERMKLIQ